MQAWLIKNPLPEGPLCTFQPGKRLGDQPRKRTDALTVKATVLSITNGDDGGHRGCCESHTAGGGGGIGHFM